jgi:hypothetical protein
MSIEYLHFESTRIDHLPPYIHNSKRDGINIEEIRRLITKESTEGMYLVP